MSTDTPRTGAKGTRPANASARPPSSTRMPPTALSGHQYMRLQALRAAVDVCRNRPTAGDDDVLALADRFTDYIRRGRTTQTEKETN